MAKTLRKLDNDVLPFESDVREALRDVTGVPTGSMEDQKWIVKLIGMLPPTREIELGDAAEELYNAFGPESIYGMHPHLWTRIRKICVLLTALERLNHSGKPSIVSQVFGSRKNKPDAFASKKEQPAISTTTRLPDPLK